MSHSLTFFPALDEMSSLFSLIQSCEWDEIRRELSRASQHGYLSLNVLNEDGFSPFHALCAQEEAPLDLIKILSKTSSTSLIQLTHSRSLALHYACESGSARTVKAILYLSSQDSVTSKKFLQLRYHTRCLDIHERTPLDRAWLKFLITKHDNVTGTIHPHILYRRNNADNVVQNLIRMDQVFSVKDLTGKLASLWEKTTLLLFAGSTNSMNFPLTAGKEWNIIHAIADSGSFDTCWCPSIVMWFALKMYSYQVRWKDEDGDLPIHIAASNPTHKVLHLPRNTALRDSDKRDSERPVIDMLLQYYPNAAKVKDRRGRLPLHLAIESGKDWNEGISAITQAYPEALDEIHPETGLFPFMMSAVNRAHHCDLPPFMFSANLQHQCQPRSVDLIYRLLRENPTNVKGGIRLTAQEVYLEKKMSTLLHERNLLMNMLVKKGLIVKLSDDEPRAYKKRKRSE